jgi:hypothetical protein
MILVFQSVGTFCSTHIPLIRVCSIVISGCTPFLWSSMGILSVPVVFFSCCSRFNMSGRYFSSSSSVFATYLWVLSKEVRVLTF